MKSKYDILNGLNEKYDVTSIDITCNDDIDNFWSKFHSLYLMNKVSKKDYDLGKNIYLNS